MLTANIVVCSLHRLAAVWKIVFAKQPTFAAARFRKHPRRVVFSDPRPSDRLAEQCQSLLRRQIGAARRRSTDNSVQLFAERWRWSRLGVYVVHLSVVILLVGGLIGSLFGFEGFVNIPEGESTATIRLRTGSQPHVLDFTIRCDDFDVSFYPSGAPKEFRSSLSILEDGKRVLQKDIIVNDPLRYRGVSIFQSSYGKLDPEVMPTPLQPPPEITLAFTSRETRMRYNRTVALGQALELPEGGGHFELKAFRPAAQFGGQDIGAALVGLLTPAQGDAVEVLLPIRFPNFDRMRGGDLTISVDTGNWEGGPAQPRQERYYTGLQVTRDPGVWVVYSGFILMIVGCFITFYLSHQQLFIEIERHEGRCRVTVAGSANKNRLGIQKKVERMAAQLSAAGDGAGPHFESAANAADRGTAG
jgi:cytochrome c biogenesis protein